MTITSLLLLLCVHTASSWFQTSDGNQTKILRNPPLRLPGPLPTLSMAARLSAFNPISTSLQKIYLDCLLFHKGLQKSVVFFDTLL